MCVCVCVCVCDVCAWHVCVRECVQGGMLRRGLAALTRNPDPTRSTHKARCTERAAACLPYMHTHTRARGMRARARLVELGGDAVDGFEQRAPRAEAHRAALVCRGPLRHEHDGLQFAMSAVLHNNLCSVLGWTIWSG